MYVKFSSLTSSARRAAVSRRQFSADKELTFWEPHPGTLVVTKMSVRAVPLAITCRRPFATPAWL